MLSRIDARKLLAERVNELCREKEITYEELSSKSEVPLETVLQIADGSVKNPGIFAIAKMVLTLLKKGKTVKETADLLELTEEYVRKIQEEFRNVM